MIDAPGPVDRAPNGPSSLREYKAPEVGTTQNK